ncbi:LysR family transcriptional regulator [Leisingera daeponensis]|uniref:LysR family transcriptional regulator n=1 Tax=Leisingera daeponensis TaxID=405746 RepID=UPI001C947EE2|nr:LysR substrate-binding domain-containing protein [Leisingera daeponensis]MBY6059610.1 LysR family transcriptional regulator [Leisingera daeponensis]
MQIRQLEIFRAVMQAGSTSGAADSLNISQPAVSRMIKHTETVLAIKLFERVGGRLHATPEAHQLMEEIEPLFISLEGVRERIKDIQSGATGNLRIVATSNMASTVIAQGLSRFFDHREKFQISLHVKRWENVIEFVERGVADLGFVFSPKEIPSHSLNAQPVGMGRMVCVMPEDHPLASQTVIRPSDLRSHRFVKLETGSPLGSLIDKSFQQFEEDLPFTVETRYCQTACDLTQAISGVTIVDELTARRNRQYGLVIRRYIPQINLLAHVIFSKNRPVSIAMKKLISQVEASFLDYTMAGPPETP